MIGNAKENPAMLTIRESAKYLRVSESTIRNAINGGRLRAYRIGAGRGTLRIREADLFEFLTSCEIEKPRPCANKHERGGGTFKNLDGAKLLAAWRQQGVVDSPPDEHSVPSSESSCDP